MATFGAAKLDAVESNFFGLICDLDGLGNVMEFLRDTWFSLELMTFHPPSACSPPADPETDSHKLFNFLYMSLHFRL